MGVLHFLAFLAVPMWLAPDYWAEGCRRKLGSGERMMDVMRRQLWLFSPFQNSFWLLMLTIPGHFCVDDMDCHVLGNNKRTCNAEISRYMQCSCCIHTVYGQGGGIDRPLLHTRARKRPPRKSYFPYVCWWSEAAFWLPKSGKKNKTSALPTGPFSTPLPLTRSDTWPLMSRIYGIWVTNITVLFLLQMCPVRERHAVHGTGRQVRVGTREGHDQRPVAMMYQRFTKTF